MKKQMKMIFVAGLAVAGFALPGVRAASANVAATNPPAATAKPADAMTALFGDPVIVKAKGFEIKRSELDEVMTSLKSNAAARGQTIPPAQLAQIEGQLLNQLMQIQLLLQKATDADRSNGVQKTDMQISNLLAQAGSQEALDRRLKAVGMTMPELRSKMTQEGTAQSALTRELNVTVTDAEVKQFYNDHPVDFEQPEMVHVRHILLMTIDPVTHTPLTADQQKTKQKQADDLLKRIRGGGDFAALAKQYSEDPGSKDNGGDLPAFPRGQMVPEFEAAAFSMTNNQVSDVITSQYGYHIIQLLGKTPAKTMDFATATPRIKDYLVLQKSEKLAPAYLDKLKKAADVQILDADLKETVAQLSAAAAAAATNAPPPVPMPEK
ncbi:MAG: peptidylprolyl isomerase [Limisphaerales bacterium]